MCLGRKISYITFLTHRNKVFVILNPCLLKTQNLRGPIAKSKDEVSSSSNRQSGKFWTSIPLPASSPSSFLSPFPFLLKELSMYFYIYFFLSSTPLCSMYSFQALFLSLHQNCFWSISSMTYMLQKTVFQFQSLSNLIQQHETQLVTPYSLKHYLLLSSSTSHFWLSSHWFLFVKVLCRFLFFLTSCAMAQSLNLISYLIL